MFNPTTDFAAVVDGIQTLTLRRRGSTAAVGIAAACVTGSQTQEASTSKGRVARADATWHFTLPDGADPPRLGDVIEEDNGRRWTILSISPVVCESRYRCACRDLELAFSLCDRVDIQVAVWDAGSPPSIVGWNTLAAGVAARIQPTETLVDQTTSPPTSTSRFAIHLAEDWPLDHCHRLIGPDGTIYKIEQYEQAERIDALPIVTAVRE